VLEDFEEGQDVCFFVVRGGDGEVFDGCVEVGEFWGLEGWVGTLVGLGDGEDGGGRVDGCYAVGVREAGGGFGEDAAAAADVEVSEFVVWGWAWGGDRGETGGDEGVAEGVHEMEEAGGAVGVPPGGGEAGEVGDFGGGDGGLGGRTLERGCRCGAFLG